MINVEKIFNELTLEENISDYIKLSELQREQEELERNSHGIATACEYCNGSGKCFIVDDDIPFGSYNSIRLDGDKAFLDDADGLSIRIKFCPMCGRRLEEV